MDEKKRAKAQEIEWIQQLDPEATFKPKTNNYVSSSQQLTHGDKCIDLYSRVKAGSYARKNNQEVDVEFESNKEECFFTPQINEFGSHMRRPDQNLEEIKGVKEKCQQLKKGREQQLARQATMNRNPGIALNQGKKKKKGK